MCEQSSASSATKFRHRGEKAIMSDTATVPPKAEPQQSGPANQDAFAQVEKWLAIIRELAREPAKRVS